MPLTYLRLGWMAWQHRRLLAWLLAIAAASLVAIPLLVGALVSAAIAGLAHQVSTPVPPMATWHVTQDFGCTGFVLEPPRNGCAHFHAGIDLGAAHGVEVRSVLPGVATVMAPSGNCGGYGLHVVVRHQGDLVTLYGHLDAVTVSGGQPVSAGTVIGNEGSSGCSSGPHLHFEVRRSGQPVDPGSVFPTLFGSGNRPDIGDFGSGPKR